MNEVVVDTLQCLPRMISNVHVFYGALQKELGPRISQREWQECLEKIGISDFHWHDLCHTFASQL